MNNFFLPTNSQSFYKETLLDSAAQGVNAKILASSNTTDALVHPSCMSIRSTSVSVSESVSNIRTFVSSSSFASSAILQARSSFASETASSHDCLKAFSHAVLSIDDASQQQKFSFEKQPGSLVGSKHNLNEIDHIDAQLQS